MLMILCLSFLIFPLVLSIDCGTDTIHNATYGIYFPFDSLDFMEHSKISGNLLGIIERDVMYPVPNPWKNPHKISFISVEDRLGKGRGACSYITIGGVGHNNTSMRLVSQRGHGIDSIVRIYIRRI